MKKETIISDFATSWIREHPEDKEIVFEKITSSEFAFKWGFNYKEDKDRLVNFIDNEKHAYHGTSTFSRLFRY